MKCNFKRKRLIFVVPVAIFVGFVLINYINDWDVSDKLGNNYVFTSDNGILYQINGHNYFVIPFGITSINHDAKWIIAKTASLNASYRKCSKQCNDGSQYWIINKEASIVRIDSMRSFNMMLIKGYEYPIISNGIIGPLDSISFNNKLNELRIRLAFQK